MIKRILTAAVLIAGIGLGIWLKGLVLRIILLACMLLSGISQGTQLYIITPYLQDIGYSAPFAASASKLGM